MLQREKQPRSWHRVERKSSERGGLDHGYSGRMRNPEGQFGKSMIFDDFYLETKASGSLM